MASSTVATRLPETLLREITRFAKRRRMGPSEALRAIVDEWVTTAKCPAIEFRDGPIGRRPGLRGGPDVWEVVMVARDVGSDAEVLREYFGPHLSSGAIEQALAYAAEHRDEVDAWVDENDRIGEEFEPPFPARGRRMGREARRRAAGRLAHALGRERDVVFGYLYGSFLDGVVFRDVDVGIQVAGGAAEAFDAPALADRLSAAAGLPADVRILNGAPASFLYHVMRGQLLLSRDDGLLEELMERTVRQYLDAAPLLRRAAREAFAA